ncbi:MAG: aspartyl protease family protein [Acidobacteriota bacterium]
MSNFFQCLRCSFKRSALIALAFIALGARIDYPQAASANHVIDNPTYSAKMELSDYNLLFTRVKIDDRDALALIDSGSFRAVQLSSTLAQEIKLALTETGKVAKRHEGKEIYLRSGHIDSLAVGDYTRRDVSIEVIEGDIENISSQVKTKFDVILGWGFLSQFHALLNYKELSMKFGAKLLITDANALRLNYSVVNGVPVVKAKVNNEEVSLLFDTGAPMCNLDISSAQASAGAKVSRDVLIADRRLAMEFRAKDLSVIRKSLGCVGVIGNDFLSHYVVCFDPGDKVIRLSGE